MVGVDGWMMIEILIFALQTGYCILSAIWIFTNDVENEIIPARLWDYYRFVLLIVCFLALNRPLMYLQSLGPFIQMLSQTVNTTAQFAFLFLEFAIPFVCGIWIMFGDPAG